MCPEQGNYEDRKQISGCWVLGGGVNEGVTALWVQVSFGGDEVFWNQMETAVAQPCECT